MSFPKVHALNSFPPCASISFPLLNPFRHGGDEQVGALDRCRGTSPGGVGKGREKEGRRADKEEGPIYGDFHAVHQRPLPRSRCFLISLYNIALPYIFPLVRLRRVFCQAQSLTAFPVAMVVGTNEQCLSPPY